MNDAERQALQDVTDLLEAHCGYPDVMGNAATYQAVIAAARVVLKADQDVQDFRSDYEKIPCPGSGTAVPENFPRCPRCDRVQSQTKAGLFSKHFTTRIYLKQMEAQQS